MFSLTYYRSANIWVGQDISLVWYSETFLCDKRDKQNKKKNQSKRRKHVLIAQYININLNLFMYSFLNVYFTIYSFVGLWYFSPSKSEVDLSKLLYAFCSFVKLKLPSENNL